MLCMRTSQKCLAAPISEPRHLPNLEFRPDPSTMLPAGGYSSMVELQASILMMGVRFPLAAQFNVLIDVRALQRPDFPSPIRRHRQG